MVKQDMITREERMIIECIRTARTVKIECENSDGAIMTIRYGGIVPHDVAVAVQNHFNNLSRV